MEKKKLIRIVAPILIVRTAHDRRGKGKHPILLLLLYSVGHGILAVVAGTSVGFVQKLTMSGRYGRLSTILKSVMGTLILGIGLYMFYLGF